MSSADVIFNLKPTYAKFSHIWSTNIQTSIRGKTTRSALYSWPRVSIEYQYIKFDYEDLSYLKKNLFKNGAGIWGIPLWFDFTLLSIQASASQPILDVDDTEFRHFYEGRDVIITYGDIDSYEIGTILTISSDGQQITLDSNLSNEWSAGAFVIPLYDMRIDPVSASKIFKETESFTISAMESFEEERDFSYSIPSSGSDTYLGLDIFDITPLYPVEYDYNYPYEMFQSVGLGYAKSLYDSSNLEMKMVFIKKQKEDIQQILDFFDSKKGMFQKFWIPTFSKDLVFLSGITPTQWTFVFENINYCEFYFINDVVGRHIYVTFPSGNIYQRKVTNCPSDSILSLDSAFGETVSLEDASLVDVSFLMLVTMAIDEITVEYPNGLNYGNIELSFKILLEELESD